VRKGGLALSASDAEALGGARELGGGRLVVGFLHHNRALHGARGFLAICRTASSFVGVELEPALKDFSDKGVGLFFEAIFLGANPLPVANETFARLRTPAGFALYEAWAEKHCSGWRAWLAAIMAATADSTRTGTTSWESKANVQRAAKERMRLLRKNTLAVHRLAGLAIAEALSNGGYKMEPPSPHRGPGRSPKRNIIAEDILVDQLEIRAGANAALRLIRP
jgi:hypothetical protein